MTGPAIATASSRAICIPLRSISTEMPATTSMGPRRRVTWNCSRADSLPTRYSAPATVSSLVVLLFTYESPVAEGQLPRMRSMRTASKCHSTTRDSLPQERSGAFLKATWVQVTTSPVALLLITMALVPCRDAFAVWKA
jgi:hypothetical protein